MRFKLFPKFFRAGDVSVLCSFAAAAQQNDANVDFNWGTADAALFEGCSLRFVNDVGGGAASYGLFVARTYMAKMGGTIVAANLADGRGVRFTLSLPKA